METEKRITLLEVRGLKTAGCMKSSPAIMHFESSGKARVAPGNPP